MEFQKALERFLQFCSVERRLSHHTISAYSFDLLDFKKWLSPEKSLEDVSEEDLRFYLDDMVSKRNLSVATVRRRLACLRGFFRHQKEWKTNECACKRMAAATACHVNIGDHESAAISTTLHQFDRCWGQSRGKGNGIICQLLHARR